MSTRVMASVDGIRNHEKDAILLNLKCMVDKKPLFMELVVPRRLVHEMELDTGDEMPVFLDTNANKTNYKAKTLNSADTHFFVRFCW